MFGGAVQYSAIPRLSKCHKIYTSIILDSKLYPIDMYETTNKYNFPNFPNWPYHLLPPYITQIYLLL